MQGCRKICPKLDFLKMAMLERIYNPIMAMGFFGKVYLSDGQTLLAPY